MLAHNQSETNLEYLRSSRWQASEKLEINLGYLRPSRWQTS